jgi:hypothetical protein
MKVFIIDDVCTKTPYLIRLTFFELWGFSLKLHIILRSDADRDHHDHPWTFWTWMLCGGYWELREATEKETVRYYGQPTKTKSVSPDLEHDKWIIREWIRPGRMRLCRAPYAHRLELRDVNADNATFNKNDGVYEPEINTAVTLVFMFPQSRDWGFHTKDGWTHWKKYLGSKKC